MSSLLLDIIWDDLKAQGNLLKHGITFAQAAKVMLDPLALTTFDAVHSSTEERWFTLGLSSGGHLLAISHTYRIIDSGSAQIRLISARKATRREQQYYEHEPR